MKKVLIQSVILPHYRVPLYNKISEREDIDVTVIFTPYNNTRQNLTGIDHSQMSRSFKEERVKVIEFGTSKYKFFYQRGLLRYIRKNKPDVYVTQANQYEISSILALLYCKWKKIPIVHWTKGYADTSKRNYFLNRFIILPLYKLGDIYLPYGISTSQYLVRLGIKRRNIVPSYNTVDVETINSKRSVYEETGMKLLHKKKVKQAPFIICSIGRLVQKKNMDQLCYAMRKLIDKGYPLIVVIGGYGPEEKKIKKLIISLKLEDSVFLVGKLPNSHDNALLAVSDLAVFCGANGLAILQAMALRVPVLIADETGADSEAIQHLETGLRYKKNDIDDMTHWIEKVIKKEVPTSKIVQNAETEVLEKRNLTRYAQAMTTAIQKASQLYSK